MIKRVRQFSQIVAKYPAASIRTKLSSGIRSLRNAQVVSIRHLQPIRDFLFVPPALEHSNLQSPFPLRIASTARLFSTTNSTTLMEHCLQPNKEEQWE